jgi:pimeloyl-ACP methyl ester carboxylesterase
MAHEAQRGDAGLIRHRSVDAGGLRVHLAEAGPEHAPPVLLLHGWPQTHWEWRHVGPMLAAEHRVLMPDLRGFGETEVTEHGMDPETFARDQVALLDALGIERAGVVGHDWGGYTAFLLAARFPERVTAALVCNAPHPWVTVTPAIALHAWRGWYAAVLASPIGPELLRRTDVVKRALTADNDGSGFTPDDLERFGAAFRPPERARAVQRLYRSYLRAFADVVRGADGVPRLRVPARLLFGARDVAVTKALVEDFPDLELVPDAGHFIVDERPELVAERARALFASVA